MDVGLLLRGLIIGFSIAAPVGPIGVLCIRRTLAQGRAAGLVSGLGAASADAVYGGIAGFGLTFLSGFLVSQQSGLRLVGGLFLCYLGLKTLLSPPAKEIPSVRQGQPRLQFQLLSNYASTFFLTLTNPVTILSFAAIFAGLGIASSGGDLLSAGLLVSGVFGGSSLWWLFLSGVAGLFREKIGPGALRWINRASGLVILGFGLAALASLLS